MNGIEDNFIFTKKWKELGQNLPNPQAILCISAHWETNGTWVTAMGRPDTIHDFYGFPDELYSQHYAAQGAREP